MGKRDKTAERLRAKFEDLKERNIPIGPASFARHVGIDRSYLYTFTELVAEISAYGRKMQPGKSNRGPGINVARARKRALDSRKLQEHAQWSKLVPELKDQVDGLQRDKANGIEELKSVHRELEVLRGAYEYLLLIAVEAGASPSEIEKIQASLGRI